MLRSTIWTTTFVHVTKLLFSLLFQVSCISIKVNAKVLRAWVSWQHVGTMKIEHKPFNKKENELQKWKKKPAVGNYFTSLEIWFFARKFKYCRAFFIYCLILGIPIPPALIKRWTTFAWKHKKPVLLQMLCQNWFFFWTLCPRV